MIKQDWGRLQQGYSHYLWVHWSKAATGMQLSAMRALIKLDCEWLQQGYNYPPSEHWSSWTAKDCNRDTVISRVSTDQHWLWKAAAAEIQLSAKMQQGYSYQPSEHWSSWTSKGSRRDTVISQENTDQTGLQKTAAGRQWWEHWWSWTTKECSRDTVLSVVDTYLRKFKARSGSGINHSWSTTLVISMRTLIKLDCSKQQQWHWSLNGLHQGYSYQLISHESTDQWMDCERLHQGYSYQLISHESIDQWMDCERLHQGYSYQRISYESTDQWAAKDCSYPKTDKTSPLNTIIKIIVKCTNNFQFSIFI